MKNKGQSKLLYKYYKERKKYEQELLKNLPAFSLDENSFIRKRLLFDDDDMRWVINLDAWQYTIFVCLDEIRFSLKKGLAWCKMAERYSTVNGIVYFQYYIDNAIYRLFACRDKVAHLLYFFHKQDIKFGSSEDTKELRLRVNDIKKKIKGSPYINFLEKIEKIIKPYEELRHAKTHREEPGMKFGNLSLGPLWAKQKETEISFVKPLLFDANKIKNNILYTYNEITIALKKLFNKMDSKILEEVYMKLKKICEEKYLETKVELYNNSVMLVDKLLELNKEIQEVPINSNSWLNLKSQIEMINNKIEDMVRKLYEL